MQITREADLAIRCVCLLAHRPGKTASIGEISMAATASGDRIAKVIQKLAKAKIIKPSGRADGIFELAVKPSAISFLDVIEAIDGPAAFGSCGLNNGPCSPGAPCAIHPLWVDILGQVRKVLANKNFAEFKPGCENAAFAQQCPLSGDRDYRVL